MNELGDQAVPPVRPRIRADPQVSLLAPEVMFFIVGTGRCGSTLLQSMIGAHPEAAIPPETHFFYRFDPGKRFSDPIDPSQHDAYMEWVQEQHYFPWLGIDPVDLRAALNVHPGARELFMWFMTVLTAGSGSVPPGANPRFLGEKSPPHWDSIDRIASLFPDAKFIHIHRDPRDVVVSLAQVPWWPQKTACRSALYWRKVLTELSRWQDRLGGDRMLTVRYETLVEQPREQLARVLEFLGLPFDEAVLEHHAHKSDTRRYYDFERAWKAMSDGPLQKSRIGRYRAVLTGREIRGIERIVGHGLLDRFGYQPDPDAPTRPYWPVLDYFQEQSMRVGRELRRGARRVLPIVRADGPIKPSSSRSTAP